MKKLLTLIVSLIPISTFALGLINDFEWLEPNTSVEVMVGEPYQLKFNCSDNSLPFTSDYVDCWNHYDFAGGQHMVSTPTGYSIDDKGVITGLVPGSYAIKFTGFIQAKSGAEKMLMITVVSERSEAEPNNTFDTANDIHTKIRFGLYNTSDIDIFKFTNSNLKWGDNVTFKIHYYGSNESPFGYKWSTFCGTDLRGSGSLMSQDQECKALVTSENTVYLEVYYDQSRSQYFNYGEEFVAEVYINGVPASEYGNDDEEESSILCYNWDENTKEAQVTSNPNGGYEGNIEIPQTVIHEGVTYTVTSIGENAFSGCSGLTSVTIGNSVTSIGDRAFSGCSGLTSVTIGNSVTSIGEFAFSGCSGLTSIEIPNSVTSIGDRAFSECSGLTSVTIGNSVTSIGEFAFSGCSGLTSIEIPNSVTSIGDRAFSECSGLTSVTIGNSVTSIGDNAFCDCSGLTSVTFHCKEIGLWFSGTSIKEVIIGDEVTSIGEGAFSGCSGLTSIEIPNSVTSIGESAFSGCSGLTSIEIPNSVTSIGEFAFSGCSGLTSISIEDGNTKYDSRNNCNAIIETSTNTLIAGCMNSIIPNSVTSIGDYAFEWCSGLTSIEIPNSVTSIGESAFDGCSGLTSVTIGNSVTSIGDNAFCDCSGLTSVTFHCKEIGLWFSGTSIKEVIIGDEVTSIGEGAFSGCSGLTSISIEDGNTKYDSRNNCNAIIETSTNTLIAGCMNSIIPNSVTSIGEFAFSDCSGLTSIEIPNSVTSIGGAAFSGCSGLTSIEIPNSVTSIGDEAFYFCTGLTSVTIGNSVTSIGGYAFRGCKGLTSVTIPNSVTSIGVAAFERCSGLTSISVENGNPKYDTRDNCNAIIETSSNTLIAGCKTSIIPNSVTSIGYRAFYWCRGLTSIEIPNSVTSIGDYAFDGCDGLTSITIGNSVTSIGTYAFDDCSSLTSITCLAPNPPSCEGQYVFYGVNKSACILKVPEASIDLYKTADQWKDFSIIETTGIQELRNEKIEGLKYYDLNGNQSPQPRKGLNIVRMSNGKTKKVLVK